MDKPKLPPGVKDWHFGTTPLRGIRPQDHPAYRNEQLREQIAERKRLETVKDNAEVFSNPRAVAEHWVREYPELARDPDRLADANARLEERLEEGAPNTWDVYKAVGDEMMKDYGLRKKGA